MTPEEYNTEKLRLIKVHNGWIKYLNKTYVDENHKYNVGDIIEDHSHIIKVEKISVGSQMQKYPCAVYHGVELTKKLKPTKKQNNITMWESNIERQLS